MRLDDYLSTVGIVKRRTVAKALASSGMIEVNDRRAKPSYQVQVGDIVVIKGNQSTKSEVLDIPAGSVNRERRASFFRSLPAS